MDCGINGVSIQNQEHIEEQLGSVTHTQDNDSGIQLRTSARVSKKLRLDSLNQAAASAGINQDKKETGRDEDKKTEVTATTVGEVKPRIRRAPEQWSTEDKNAFFEALSEYGKDFEAIQQHMIMKAKKRGEQTTKNKDQARFFYYRMWHKISKHLKFPPNIKKGTQELYGLINFGELRKKLGFVTEKTSVKLNELIYSGSTQLRVRGKTWRVKTPVCKALRKLNLIEECSEELRLPTRITVEMRPRFNEDWTRVQTLSQNPRLRTILTLHQRLEALLSYLNSRWTTTENKLRQKLVSEAGLENETLESESDKISEDEEWTLHVGPKPGTYITEPTVRLSEMATSSKLSLQSYEERFDPSTNAVAAMLDQLQATSKTKSKTTLKRQRTESTSDKTPASKCIEEVNNHSTQGQQLPDTTEVKKRQENDKLGSPIGQLLTVHWETEDAQMGNPDGLLSPGANGEWNSPNKEIVEAEILKQENEEALNNFSNSWTIHNCGATRIGDLYLMFGSKSKVRLDYWWERSKPPVPLELVQLLDNGKEFDFEHPVPVGSDEYQPVTSTTPNSVPRNDLATTLKKLLSIVKLHQTKTKVHCPCGHICGGDSKLGTSSKSRVGGKSHDALIEKVEPERKELKLTVCPLSLDGVFRRPLVIQRPAQVIKPTKTEKTPVSVDKFRTRYCNRRGRTVRPKPVPASRVVPLLPKTQINRHDMFAAMVDNTLPRFKPIAPASSVSPVPLALIASGVHTKPVTAKVGKVSKKLASPKKEAVTSPTSFSNLLDDLSLPGSTSSLLETTPSFVGLLRTDSTLPVQATPPVSPSRLLKEEENQWLNSEVADFSLSSFLNHLEALPIKPSETMEDTRLSDVDAQFNSLLNENCTDLTAQIADLTAQITEDGLPTPKFE